MKKPIEWHEDCLKNKEIHTGRLKDDADRIAALAILSAAKCAFYRQQIEEAKRRGKDGFDRDKFMQKRMK